MPLVRIQELEVVLGFTNIHSFHNHFSGRLIAIFFGTFSITSIRYLNLQPRYKTEVILTGSTGDLTSAP